jgi:hypothetical protein
MERTRKDLPMAYSPTMMRFAQQDPAGYVDGLNDYQFVADNPINHLDPQGLKIEVYPTKTPSAGDKVAEALQSIVGPSLKVKAIARVSDTLCGPVIQKWDIKYERIPNIKAATDVEKAVNALTQAIDMSASIWVYLEKNEGTDKEGGGYALPTASPSFPGFLEGIGKMFATVFTLGTGGKYNSYVYVDYDYFVSGPGGRRSVTSLSRPRSYNVGRTLYTTYDKVGVNFAIALWHEVIGHGFATAAGKGGYDEISAVDWENVGRKAYNENNPSDKLEIR